MITIQGEKKIVIATQAQIIDDSKDCAWAERAIYSHPAFKWVLGKYVEADAANSNDQYWSLADLRSSHKTIKGTPMNLLHRSRHIVGHYADAELLYPVVDGSSEEPNDTMSNPFIEALGIFWKHIFSEEYAAIEKAHNEGNLFFSMECVADTITEMWPDGTEGATFEYKGPKHPSYSEAINNRECSRRFNNTKFLGGALIVPPELPGWSGAEVKDISTQLGEQLEAFMDTSVSEKLSMDAKTWESVMSMLCSFAQ